MKSAQINAAEANEARRTKVRRRTYKAVAQDAARAARLKQEGKALPKRRTIKDAEEAWFKEAQAPDWQVQKVVKLEDGQVVGVSQDSALAASETTSKDYEATKKANGPEFTAMLNALVAVAAQELANMKQQVPTANGSNLSQLDRSQPNNLNVELRVGQDKLRKSFDGDRTAAENGEEDKTTSKSPAKRKIEDYVETDEDATNHDRPVKKPNRFA